MQGCGPEGFDLSGSDTARATLSTALNATVHEEPALKAFYEQREFRPLWLRGSKFRREARQLVTMLTRSGEHGLAPERYSAHHLAAVLSHADGSDPESLAATEILLSRAYAQYVMDLHQPARAQMISTDPAVAPPPLSARSILEAAARASSLRKHLSAVQRMNPIYEGLREGLAAYRARWSQLPRIAVSTGPALADGARGERVHELRRRLGLPATNSRASLFDEPLAQAVRSFQKAHGLAETGIADAETIEALNAGPETYERLIQANMDRARALPANPGRRYIVVDAATARLWTYENGRVRDSMRVIVGKPDLQTPAMSGMIRFAVVNPYWNVPPDLVRDRIAPRVLDEGIGHLREARYEMLSDWSDRARVLAPEEVDWNAVAAGREELRVRQLPGPDNSMGAIKFMMPNHLGIYLHDTPDKELFDKPDRRLSAGCVRVEDARRLSRWLFGGNAVGASVSEPEQRKDLPAPVPVYITYLTAVAGPEGLVFNDDVYRRDQTLLAQSDAASAKLGTQRGRNGGGRLTSR